MHGRRAVLDAVAAHVARRAHALGRTMLSAGGGAGADPWRALCLRCGVDAVEPLSAAIELLSGAERAVLLVMGSDETTWGGLVAEEVARLTAEGSSEALVLVCSESAPKLWTNAVAIALDDEATVEERHLFWEAIAEDAERRVVGRIERLAALDGWWSAASATPLEHRSASPSPRGSARRLLVRLAMSRRPWPQAELGRLVEDPRGARAELEAMGLVDIDARGWVTAKAQQSGDVVDADDARAVAEALSGLPGDPWAWARAAELFASLGLAERAEAAAERALTEASDPTARADLWQRWGVAMKALAGAGSGAAERQLRAAELALRLGDVEFAIDFSTAAVRAGPSFEALLVHGRATSARGDLTTAAMVLARAVALAPDAAARARGGVEIAELCCKTGDVAAARRHAEAALADAGEPATRLNARNVLGKLLLSAKAWAEAEQHFAADAWDAAQSSELVSELRARLNRAIALLSSGRLDEARSMLSGVLEEGERRGERLAAGYALTNLAVIAHLKHEYVEAQRLLERAIDVIRVVGDKVALVNLISNLAEIRLQLGLVPEAEQALSFCRKVCGPVIPGVRVAYMAVVAARIHLYCGRTGEAWAELSQVITSGSGAINGVKLGEGYAVAARIALEDGDLERAEGMIALARAETSSDRAATEVALLDAMRARAAGEPFGQAALEALSLARKADDRERACEAHVLLHHAAEAAGDAAGARGHLEAAIRLRDRIAASLPAEVAERFLARRGFAELCELEARARSAALARVCEDCGSSACAGCERPSARAGAAASTPAIRRIVGADPAIQSLLSQIHKVGSSEATVLIHGESGTGKELVAEAIHQASPRRVGPLVKVNCAALVETLLLSELFGHEKGSFTGAASRRRGRFEVAEGGTLFLDEIGDISPRTQVALLRVLQDRTFERVGGVTPLRANVRILCATHRDLRAMVARGEFREDLFYRLRQLVLEVPALRQRAGDLPLIAHALLGRIAAERGAPQKRLSRGAVAALSRYAWPGNVRELENALRAAAIFADGDLIELEDLTANVEGLRGLADGAVDSAPAAAGQGDRPSSPQALVPPGTFGACEPPSKSGSSVNAQSDGVAPSSGTDRTPVELAYAHVRGGISLSDMKREIERECISRALADSGGNITRAATLLGMKRPRLSQLVKQYGFGSVSED